MKVWSNFSAIAKLALICLIVGFVLGICSAGLRPLSVEPPSPASSAPMSAAMATYDIELGHAMAPR